MAIFAALAAAFLFGISAPLAKVLLRTIDPWALAALLYLGSGCGLVLLRALRGRFAVELDREQWRWLAIATAIGGVVAPILLMSALRQMPASEASLLLNAESVFTTLLAWRFFGENAGARVAAGLVAIVAGAVVIGWPTNAQAGIGGVVPTLAVLGTCLAWALDNNLMRRVSLADVTDVAMLRGLAAGTTNLVLAFAHGASLPEPSGVASAMTLGFFSYGGSLSLYVYSLRHLGAARSGACFAVAPFFGAAIALLLLHEPLTAALAVSAILMAAGVALTVAEPHAHQHTHERMEHVHEHVHGTGDLHHEHVHEPPVPAGTRHSHPHRHDRLTHTHPHFPDAHHQHVH
ncbi:MAG TPA: EamA family transporter [Candidatus Binatia bacterium]|jgi:drug/metabolite transporter (DMT)-like permease